MEQDVLAQLFAAGIYPADFNLWLSGKDNYGVVDGPQGCIYMTLCAGSYFDVGSNTQLGSEDMNLTEFSPVGSPYSSSVPEPGTSTLLLTGLLLLGLMTAAEKRAWLRPGHQEAV